MASPPNVGDLLQNQQAYNTWNLNTQLNAGRVNTTNPYGSQQWTMDPATGQWTLNQSFSPDQQRLYASGQQLAGRGLDIANGIMSDPANYSRINYQGPSYTYDGGSRDRAEQALYSRATRYLDPQYNQAEQQLWDRMQAMGFNTSDPGFRTQLDTFNQGRERAYGAARDSAIAGGGEEATAELQRALAAEGARTGFLRGERSDMAALYGQLRAGAQPTPGWTAPPSQFGTPGMPQIDSISPQLAAWNAQQAAGANNQAGWWGLGNSFINSPAGQGAINRILNGIGGFFGT